MKGVKPLVMDYRFYSISLIISGLVLLTILKFFMI